MHTVDLKEGIYWTEENKLVLHKFFNAYEFFLRKETWLKEYTCLYEI